MNWLDGLWIVDFKFRIGNWELGLSLSPQARPICDRQLDIWTRTNTDELGWWKRFGLSLSPQARPICDRQLDIWTRTNTDELGWWKGFGLSLSPQAGPICDRQLDIWTRTNTDELGWWKGFGWIRLNKFSLLQLEPIG